MGSSAVTAWLGTLSHVAPELLVSGGSGWLLSIGEGSLE